MVNSAEHEICPANKSQNTNNCKFFLAKQTEHENFSANNMKISCSAEFSMKTSGKHMIR